MNIHTLTQNKEALALGPFKVEKSYPRNADGKYSFYLISDSTGKSALKVWGADLRLVDGASYTLQGVGQKGGLKYVSYNGKDSIDANSCMLVDPTAAPSAPAQAAPAQQYQAPAVMRSESEKNIAIGADAAEVIDSLVSTLQERGYSRAEAIQLSVGSAHLKPLYWFGEKGLG